jgi:hypothetical protein
MGSIVYHLFPFAKAFRPVKLTLARCRGRFTTVSLLKRACPVGLLGAIEPLRLLHRRGTAIIIIVGLN